MQDLINNLSNNSSNKNSSISNCIDLFNDAEYSENNSSISKLFKNCNDDALSSIKNDTSESKSLIQGTISSSLKDNILLNSIIYGMMYCRECKIPCSIIFNDNFTISFECGCSLIKYISIKEFINDYINKEKSNIKKEKYLMHCKYHFKQTEFIKYCIDCESDLCSDCFNDKYF